MSFQVPVYVFNDHVSQLRYMSKYDKELDVTQYLYDHPHPEGYFGFFGDSWNRVYKHRKNETQYYYPVIVCLYDTLSIIDKIIIPDNVINGIKSGNVKILFICPYEGWEWSYWENMISGLQKRYNFVRHEDCVVLTGNLTKHPTIKSVYFNFWEQKFFFNNINDHYIKGNDSIRSKELKEKKFIFLNRRASSERIGAASLMFKHKEEGYLSLSKTGYYDNYFPQAIKELEEKYKRLYSVYTSSRIEKHLPLKINDGIDVEAVTPCDDKNEDKFYNSYLHIVSETFMFNGNRRMFYSEKTFKPIFFMQPFILLGEANSLKNLQKLGYKTFPDFINESYDSIENDEDRIFEAIKSAETFISTTHKKLQKRMVEMLPILNHNICHLQYRCMMYEETVRLELLKHLKG